GKITNNNGESAFSEFIWSEEILNQPEILKLAAPGRDGSVQFGICAIHNGTLELADNLLGHAVFSDEPRREADSISQSQLIRNRVTDLEVIYIQDYDAATGSAGLSDIMLTWTYLFRGDTDKNSRV